MLVKYLLPAAVAVGSVAAQSATCTVSTTTINSQAEATKLAGCKTVKGSIVLGNETGADINLSGPKEITGDLTVMANRQLENFQSSSLETIGGAFTLNDVNAINTVNFPKLNKVEKLILQSVARLATVQFGPLTEAEEVTISDTFLQTLDPFDLTTVKIININNNRGLQKYDSKLREVRENMIIQSNGIGVGLDVKMDKLVWAKELAIANVTTFDVPTLKVVNGSARFDSNFFTSFSAPNLTHTETGDISFVGNGDLTNMTFPKLTKIAGGLLIANNTGLDDISYFPKLETIGGAVKLRGNFTEFEFPSLKNVQGAFDVSSTGDIQKACDAMAKHAPKHQNGDGTIEGTYKCKPNNEKANEDTDSTTSGGGSGNDSGSGDDENSASGVVFNTALFGLVVVAAIASAL